MYGLTVYVKEGLPFALDLSLENSVDFDLYFRIALLHFPDCGTHSPALLDLFISSDTSLCSTMVFPPLENSDHASASVSIDFPTNSKWDAPFHSTAYDYSCADWDSLHDHLRDFHGRISLNSVL